jgi:hypothetical protein
MPGRRARPIRRRSYARRHPRLIRVRQLGDTPFAVGGAGITLSASRKRAPPHFRNQLPSAHGAKTGRSSQLDPHVWCGRALQEASSICRLAVLHQCIRPLIGAWCAPGHHGHQRAYVLISGQASSGPFGSPGFACAVKTDPPSRLNLSQTSAGNGKVVLRHRCLVYRCSSFVRAIKAVPSSRPAKLQGAARRGCQDWPPSAATRRAWS